MRYVIIGNSAAAVGGVEGIRSQDPDGEIVIIADEAHHTYSRPLISYLLQGKTDEQRMRYRPDDFYEKNRCDFRPGVRAVRTDSEKRVVELEDGTEIPYDRLLIATGSRPFVPPLPGLDTVERVHTFMKLDDARALAEDLDENTRVLIIGAGLIGLKCAEGIAGRCGSIDVTDIASHVLPSILNEDGSEMVEEILREHDIRLHLGSGVSELRGGAAVLSDGQELNFDVLVIAVGVRPNVDLFPGEAQRGIPTDDHAATAVEHIYAAGDCATSFDTTSGQERILALLPNAYMQGYAAGVNMAGGEKLYDNAIPANAMGLFGLHMITAGSTDGEQRVMRTDDSYRCLTVRDGRLVGLISIGDVARSGIYTSLIREQTPLDSIDFDLICEKPQLMAFSRKERARSLRGRRTE